MSYLISADFNRTIQDINLQQIIANDQNILQSAILAGEAECKSYLRQRFDISNEFKDTNPWNPATTYKAADRVYLSASAYATATTYNVNDLATYNGNVYICTATTTGAFDPTKWTVIGVSGAIFYAVFPATPFLYAGLYNIGDEVFWKNNTYTCKVATPLLDHDTALQYRAIENIPQPNPAPDDPQNGVSYWGAPTVYVVTPGTLPTDTNTWTQADNRDQQIVMYLIDIVLFHIHSRIAPRNVPELRAARYTNAINWLNMVKTGDVTPELPVLQPVQGGRVRYGGNLKQINSF
jgi:hypothetical protein